MAKLICDINPKPQRMLINSDLLEPFEISFNGFKLSIIINGISVVKRSLKGVVHLKFLAKLGQRKMIDIFYISYDLLRGAIV